MSKLFAILQKYEFSSKSQLGHPHTGMNFSCLRYCKSTSFQANHNDVYQPPISGFVVCDTAKVRVFKQITTSIAGIAAAGALFAILQKYEFSSKSQLNTFLPFISACCLRYCKSTSFQANHNRSGAKKANEQVVCDTAKVRVFKQITTRSSSHWHELQLFAILQKYEFSSKSQRCLSTANKWFCCLRYCKSTSFQANHNKCSINGWFYKVVCDTAKVRVFKQITTCWYKTYCSQQLFAILQKYEFSSKSQP